MFLNGSCACTACVFLPLVHPFVRLLVLVCLIDSWTDCLLVHSLVCLFLCLHFPASPLLSRSKRSETSSATVGCNFATHTGDLLAWAGESKDFIQAGKS